jgi:hypothetical protein
MTFFKKQPHTAQAIKIDGPATVVKLVYLPKKEEATQPFSKINNDNPTSSQVFACHKDKYW